MECSLNNTGIDNHFSMIEEQNSEVDVLLDNDQMILSSLMSEIETSLSRASIHTAMTFETSAGGMNLDADADPPLATRMSMSTASDLSGVLDIMDVQETNATIFNKNELSPMKVVENENGIKEFEMLIDGKKVKVIDLMEYVARLQSPISLEPVFLDSQINLGAQLVEHFESEEIFSEEDVKTAEIGPSFDDFPQYLRNVQ